jgi:hypothetical protein
MKIKKLQLSKCSYCNSIAIGKIDNKPYCQYHFDKELILIRDTNKNQGEKYLLSTFPEYNRVDIPDYIHKKMDNRLKIKKEIELECNSIMINLNILNAFDELIKNDDISVITLWKGSLAIEVIMNNHHYIFSFAEVKSLPELKELIRNNKIRLVFERVGNRIVKYF